MAEDDPIRQKPTIRVDADACAGTVRRSLEQISRKMKLALIFYIDDSHELQPEYGQVQQVGKGRDAVDLALINQTKPGDIVITQDYGLAALVLGRRARAIHPSGMAYTNENIDRLLMERHYSAKARQAGERTRNPKKRQKSDDLKFDEQFMRQLESLLDIEVLM